jgi:hypothetical protein
MNNGLKGWLAILLVAVLVFWGIAHVMWPSSKPMRVFAPAPTSTTQQAQAILNAIPDNGSITYAQFEQKVPDAKFISFANPQSLSRVGQHVWVTNSAPGTLTLSSATIKTDTSVQFDVGFSSTAVVFNNVLGVHVSQGLVGGDLKNLSVSPLANGHYVIDGTVHVGFIFGDVNFSKEIDQNGNVVN